jgi:hypothetical protein
MGHKVGFHSTSIKQSSSTPIKPTKPHHPNTTTTKYKTTQSHNKEETKANMFNGHE